MSEQRCPACGFRLDIDHSPCVLCQTGWAMLAGTSEGVPVSESCHATCPALREWHKRQGTIKVEDGERHA